MAIIPECNPAAEVQGPGPNSLDGNPIDVHVLTLPPVVIPGCVKVEDCPTGTPVRVNLVSTIPVPVTDNGGSLTVDGTVAVSNFPAVQPVSGTGQAFAGSQDNGSLANAGDTVTHILLGNGTAVIDANGTWPGGARIEVTNDLVTPNWVTHYGISQTSFQETSTFTSNDQVTCATAGWAAIRLRAVAGWGVGVATVTIRSSPPAFEAALIFQANLPATTFGISDTSGDPVELQRNIAGGAIRGVVYPLIYQGNYQAVYSRPRAENVYRTVATAAAGNTPLWGPIAGNKFRLMKYMMEVTGNASIAGAGAIVTISLFDGAAGATGQVHSVFVPLVALAGIGLLTTPWIDLGVLGYLSVLANNALNVNLSVALVTGACRVIACGTEE